MEGVQTEFLSERKVKVIPCKGAGDRKGAGTNSGKSCRQNLEFQKPSGEYGKVCKVVDTQSQRSDGQCT